MRVVALISGGKDSCYNMMQCVAAGHQLVALANLRPAHTDELDSYMYQTVGHQAIELYAEAMELPLYRRTIQGRSLDTGRDYSLTPGDEVEDLFQLLSLVKEKESVEAVSVGAILSCYQRVRVENVCCRLGLQPLAFLWQRDQDALLSEMVSAGLHAILIKVAAVGLDPEKHLGKTLAEMQPHLKHLSEKYGVHICGEGGEYETFTLDCPLFKKKIVIDDWETVMHSADAFAPVAYLRFTDMHTENKDSDVAAAASVLPHGACPCRSAVDEMSEEAEYYADPGRASPPALPASGDLTCQPGPAVAPSWSHKSGSGFQWLAGITGDHHEEQDIQCQTASAFLQLQRELKSKGWRMSDIVLVHVYINKMEDFLALNTVYKKHFGINPPARVCVAAPLPAPHMLQMDCLLHAWTPCADDPEVCNRREALHVQSLSHWAPANIGPYSQAYRVKELLFCAGQIALVPCTLQLLEAGSKPQAQLCLSHIQKVLQAALPGSSLSHVLQAHCYTTRPRDAQLIRAVWRDVLKTQHQHQDTLGGPNVAACPLSIAAVPTLPRGASVELHVVAALDEPGQRTHCVLTSKMAAAGRVECRGVRSSDGRSACVSVSLAGWDSLDGVDGQAVAQDMGSLLRKALAQLGGEMELLCSRVFYRSNHRVALQLIQGHVQTWFTLSGRSPPALSLVPVLELSDSQLLVLSCWLSS